MYKGKYSKPRVPVMDRDLLAEQEITEESIIAEIRAQEQAEQVEREEWSAPSEPVERKRKRTSKGTIVFYSIYAVLVLGLLVAAAFAMTLLQDFLVRFQASRPEEKSRQVYAEVFQTPDWAAIYQQVGIEDTAFEGPEEFAKYMKQKTEGKAISVLETAAGLSDNHKYVIRADEEKVATFMLVNTVTNPEELPVWELGEIELFYDRTEAVTVEKNPDHTVYINGNPLDDSYTIIKEYTAAEEYLPEGTHSYRKDTQYVDGLLMAPVVTCVDENGADVPVELGADGIYRPATQTVEEEATQAQIDRAVGASKVYAQYMVQSATNADLREYYDSQSQTYKDMIGVELFTRKFSGYFFDEENMVVSEYHRYSDTLYSIRVNLTFKVTLITGTVKEFPSDRTYFFETKSDGKELVILTSNADVHAQKREVRLDFTYDGKVESVFVDATANSVELPQVETPEGQVFIGWAQMTVDEEGKNVMIMKVTPGTAGFGVLAGDVEPMVLYPVFEKENTEVE